MTEIKTGHVWPFERTSPLDPPPVFAELRATCPVSKVSTWNGREAWLLTRYADIRAVLADPGISSDLTIEGFPEPTWDGILRRRAEFPPWTDERLTLAAGRRTSPGWIRPRTTSTAACWPRTSRFITWPSCEAT